MLDTLSPPSSLSTQLSCLIQDSPLGNLGLYTSTRGLVHISFSPSRTQQCVFRPQDELQETIAQALRRYFSGEPETFTHIPLDLQTGTVFERAVWSVLRTIPYGQTQTYQWLSERAGNAKAYRAAGQANRKNPIPIIIPCHRIINKNGQLGGYQGAGGLNKKTLLLRLERALPNDASHFSHS